MLNPPRLAILGIRGVPAAHGGFETFAEYLSKYLVKKGWEVTVYCQHEGTRTPYVDEWEGVRRVNISVSGAGAASTIFFDWKSISHLLGESPGLVLTLGYNTAVFCARLRFSGVVNLINMDGIEWAREKWGVLSKTWFWLNDWAGCFLGNHLIADHPEIKSHLMSRVGGEKITVIPYGAPLVESSDASLLESYGLAPFGFSTVIARPEPENSIFEIVSGFSQKRRGYKLVVLGRYDASNEYHSRVKSVASDEVVFLGAIYDVQVVSALRFYSLYYVHGHQVGGTNPSLVEALGAGNAVVAHDNRFNRWVAGESAIYFSGASQFSNAIDGLYENVEKLESMRAASKRRHFDRFTWDRVLGEYEQLLLSRLN